ncbi:MAG: nitrite/sulfite reductase [Nocardioidaceae bacterium]
MSITTPVAAAAPPDQVTPRRAPRDEGQWALGSTQPLNANEQLKADDDGLNVRARIEEVYAREGFASITPEDLNGRFRWWGLYTQRRPGIPGGRTASLEPHELSDEYFLLRVRSDGGRLSLAQVRAIAHVSTTYARDTADVTDRQNIQLHWIRIEDVPAVWTALESVGLTTAEACGDTPRVILGSPVAGVAADEIIDGTPAIDEIVSRYVGDPSLSNLPRKFKTAVSGSPHQDVAHEVNDLSFVGVVHPELGPGFDVFVGGGLSTNPRFAERLGAFVALEEVPEVWHAVVRLFRDYGYRRLRTKARLKFLVADWGIERFRDVLETEYLHRPLPDGPAPAAPPTRRDHVGVHPQRDGLFYVGVAPVVGRVSGTTLAALADLAESVGSDRVRLTAQQKLLVLDVPGDRVAELSAGLRRLGLDPEPSEFRRGTMACTGLEFCKLAISETKGTAARAVAELEERLPDFRHPLSLHVNGCPNSCARIQVADIGLKGQLVTDAEGQQVEGFQVHLGGELGPEDRLGRKPRGLKVTGEELPAYVERLARRFEEQRGADETFASWARRADEGDLA